MLRFIYTDRSPNLTRMADELLAAADKASNARVCKFVMRKNVKKVFLVAICTVTIGCIR